MMMRGVSGRESNAALRTRIIRRIWGQDTLPSGTPTVASSASPLTLTNTPDSVDSFTVTTAGNDNVGYHHKLSPTPGTLMLLAQGHDDTWPPNGIEATCDSLLGDSVDVMLIGMPGETFNDGFDPHSGYTTWEDLQEFLNPYIYAINQLAASYDNIHMCGISGGGWATTVMAALDPRITYSFPVAGSLPYYLRGTHTSVQGDWEQKMFMMPDYRRLYELGALETGRRQRQILNRNDDCCFARAGERGAYGTDYETAVVDDINARCLGTFDWYEDTSHSSHLISAAAYTAAIAPLL